MIDVFVLLVPLAVLPIVFFFVFFGCSLDSAGIPSAPRLILPAGLNLTVASVEVTVKVTGEEGESQSDTKSLNNAEFPPGDGFVDFFIVLEDIDAEEDGSAHCQCSLLVFGNPDFGVDLSADHDSPIGDFVLTFTAFGDKKEDFHLA
jgi:hypothetical protein